MNIKTIALTFFTLIAFAANSIFCRMALMTGSISAVDFTIVRLFSGIVVLLPFIFYFKITNTSETRKEHLKLSWSNFAQPFALFSYAIFFSIAYVELGAAIGALILFASVQITMVGLSIINDNRLTIVEWVGFVLAFSGLIYLLLPGLTAPPIVGATMMIISGISWGVYSLLGKNQKEPILSTARNFLFCLPGVLILAFYSLANQTDTGFGEIQSSGLLLAILSGAVASGLGYVLWYLTLRRITTTVASIAQLSVPIIAGFGGVIFLDELINIRLLIAAVFISGGIVVTIFGKAKN